MVQGTMYRGRWSMEQSESLGHPTHLGSLSHPGNQCGIWPGFHLQQHLGKKLGFDGSVNLCEQA